MSGTLLQSLQALPQIPASIEPSDIAPAFSFDATKLTETVVFLCKSLAQQRSFFELLEKETARRRIEVEVKLSNMQSDFESRLADDAKRRQREMEAVRGEVAKCRSDCRDMIGEMRKEVSRVEDNATRMVERNVATLKITVLEANDRIAKVSQDVSDLRTMLNDSKEAAKKLQKNIEAVHESSREQVQLLCRFNGVSFDDMVDALHHRDEPEAWRQTPQFQAVYNKFKVTDELLDLMKKDGVKFHTGFSELMRRTTNVESQIANLLQQKDISNEQLVDLRQLLNMEIAKASRRLDGLERRIGAPAVSPTKGPELEQFEQLRSLVEKLQNDVAMLPDFIREQNDNLFMGKKDIIAQFESLHLQLEKVQFQTDSFQEILDRIQEGQQSGRTALGGAAPLPSPRLDTMRQQLDRMLQRIEELEKLYEEALGSKVGKEELNSAISAAVSSSEHAIDHLQRQLQRKLTEQHQHSVKEGWIDPNATAGRFRCLSCNRDAGPLHEPIREKLSVQQFPPSNVFVAHDGDASQPSLVVRRTVPGKSNYNPALMTASRKKLMNYYEWLHGRAETQNQQGAERQTRRSSPPQQRSATPPQHVWAGSQPTGGFAGERQCGTHGSSQPDAIGSDGRFYEGVDEQVALDDDNHDMLEEKYAGPKVTELRPKSAPLRRK